MPIFRNEFHQNTVPESPLDLDNKVVSKRGLSMLNRKYGNFYLKIHHILHAIEKRFCVSKLIIYKRNGQYHAETI